MGVRGELFSTRIACDGRTYFFNVKENRMGDLFLAIVESKPSETEGFDRRSIVVFQDNVDEFIRAFTKSLEAMAKAAPSRPAGHGDHSHKPARDARVARDDGREGNPRLSDDEMPRHFIGNAKPRRADASAPGESSERPRRGDAARRDSVRHDSVRRDIDKATGRQPRTAETAGKPKGRVLRVKPKSPSGSDSSTGATKPGKPAARRMTVKRASPRHDD
ncbi:MAG TPA: DUF3276 family protein [bacterium]|nr:DUF3276 family protein [bacterium]